MSITASASHVLNSQLATHQPLAGQALAQTQRAATLLENQAAGSRYQDELLLSDQAVQALDSKAADGASNPELAQAKEEAIQRRTEVRETFDQFVGETFFRELLKGMRSSVGKPAYFHGGRAEEMYQSQLDQHLVESMASRTGSDFTEGMFNRFYGEA